MVEGTSASFCRANSFAFGLNWPHRLSLNNGSDLNRTGGTMTNKAMNIRWFSIVIFLFLVTVTVAAIGEPPTGFRNFKWGAPPGSSLKKFSGPTDEGLTMYVPLSKKPEPLFNIPVAEEDYSFVHGKFYQGDAYLDGAPSLQRMKNALVQAFGNPSFTNENLKIWKWKWPKRSIEIQLYYQAKFARTTVTFSDSAIN